MLEDIGIGVVLPAAASIVLIAVWLIGLAALIFRLRRTVAVEPLSGTPLAVRAVSTKIGGRQVLQDVSLTLRRGEVLGILGPNGSGKTTLLRIMAGLEAADAGDVLVFGNRVSASAPVLRHVGFALGRPALLPHRTGWENLRLAWADTGRPAPEARFEQVAEMSGLGPALHRRTDQYSEGMRQSTALAIAMLGMPDILVVDEPTNALDPLRIRELRDQFRAYAASGRSIIATIHDLAEAELLCDDVVVLAQGRVTVTEGSAARTSSAKTVQLNTSDNAQAAAVAARMAGVTVLEGRQSLQVATSADGDLAVLLAAINAAGLAVTSLRTISDFEQRYFQALAEARGPQW